MERPIILLHVDVHEKIEEVFIELKVNGVNRFKECIKNNLVIGAIVWRFERRQGIVTWRGPAHLIGNEVGEF